MDQRVVVTAVQRAAASARRRRHRDVFPSQVDVAIEGGDFVGSEWVNLGRSATGVRRADQQLRSSRISSEGSSRFNVPSIYGRMAKPTVRPQSAPPSVVSTQLRISSEAAVTQQERLDRWHSLSQQWSARLRQSFAPSSSVFLVCENE